ncbi:type I methionyl aminopeptidase [Secundilactobacillus folii]|uniref:Methionine aminopeptidase n=1 Tax=Secundilactobacillus folii TaxID=2678357 RepID=A0A7X2XW18_9LACO|nr:type I methionyl aminopeptidase [Secundilactobacillus folii]MTV82595.1 type I methionyl aminopeptidase [Secundilactobacillus folii]
MITIKSAREIEKMRASGAVLAGVLNGLLDVIEPGISTWEIEKFATTYIAKHGATAEEKGFEGYQYATCVNVNDEVAHATPRKKLILKSGDVVAVDLVVNLDGYLSDGCRTYAVGKVTANEQRLLDVTRKALYRGIDQAIIGNRLGDIGAAIQNFVENENHMGDVRELIGHGIQPTMHEQPDVPAYGEAGKGLRLREGMTITIEPMVNLGTRKIRAQETADHSWEYYVTADGLPSAQFEHTLAITKDGPKILTSQDPTRDAKYL